MHTETNKENSHTGAGSEGTVRTEFLESGLAVVYMGHPNERVVTLTPQRMQSLREAVQRLRQQKPTGVIFMSPHKEMFTAGADINLIQSVSDPAQGEKLAREGQILFDEIEALPFPTIAAISGPCVGGGCELALACKFRLISESKSSAIGLPEVKLGILPGFGGTQRLPRLVGITRALDIILAGKILKPKQALSAGLVDEIVRYETLIERSIQIAVAPAKVKKKPISFLDRLIGRFSLLRSQVRKKALAKVKAQTKGFYPAPLAALESVFYGYDKGVKEGLINEARELGRLIVTPESKALVNVFFLSENSKGLGKPARKAVETVNAMVIGAGVMGAGIGGVLAKSEANVILKDNNEEGLKRGLAQIKSYISGLKYLSPSEQSFILNRVEGTTKELSNTSSVNFLIEAVFEDLKLKTRLLTEAGKMLEDGCIIASNTSSLSISDLASGLENPQRVVGMHFFNPVEKMPLVEIVRGKQTADKTIVITAALAVKLGKFPIVVEDVPGFLVNRILTPYLSEAAQLLSEGYSIDAIDSAATAFGMPMGPIRLLDEVGLDVASNVAEIMAKAYGVRMQAPGYSRMLLNMGRKGKKSGAGFYDFGDKNPKPNPTIREKLNIAANPQANPDSQLITDRLILALINEAVLCLDEGVAGNPGREATQQIDLGSVMGIGFPPFRGGVLHYATNLGLVNIVSKLEKFAPLYGERFKPSDALRYRADKQLGFY